MANHLHSLADRSQRQPLTARYWIGGHFDTLSAQGLLSASLPGDDALDFARRLLHVDGLASVRSEAGQADIGPCGVAAQSWAAARALIAWAAASRSGFVVMIALYSVGAAAMALTKGTARAALVNACWSSLGEGFNR